MRRKTLTRWRASRLKKGAAKSKTTPQPGSKHPRLAAPRRSASRSRQPAVNSPYLSEARYRLLFERHPQPMWVLDRKSKAFLAVNDAASQHYGYSREEFLSMTLRDLRPTKEAARPAAHRLAAGPDVVDAGYARHRKRDGTLLDVEMLYQSISFAGRPAQLVMVEEVTPRRRAEDALRQNEELQRRILEAIPVGVVRISKDGALRSANVIAQRILGFPEGDLTKLCVTHFGGRTVWEDGTECKVEDYPVSRCLRTGDPQPPSTIGVYRPDGTISWGIYSAWPLFHAETGALAEAVVCCVDITARKRAEEELRLLQTLTLAVSEAPDFHAALNVVLRKVCEATGWILGQAWTRRPDDSAIECSRAWYSAAGGLQAFRRASQSMRFPPGVGLPGRVWDSKQAVWVSDVTSDDNLPRAPVAAKAGLKVGVGIPVLAGDRVVAALEFFVREPRQTDERLMRLISVIAAQLGTVMQRKQAEMDRDRLLAEVQKARDRLENHSHQLVLVQEAERRRIARELHDEIGQSLTALRLSLEMCEQLPPAASLARLRDARRRTDELVGRVRELSLNLRPAMLDDLGLLPALLWHFDRYMDQTGISVAFKHSGLEGRRFTSELETAAYRITQEALTNVARHARVREATVRLWAQQDTLCVQIEDRGAGFEPKTVLRAGHSAGLSGMRERASLLGGRLVIDSSPGVGTHLTVEFPLRHKQEAP